MEHHHCKGSENVQPIYKHQTLLGHEVLHFYRFTPLENGGTPDLRSREESLAAAVRHST